MRIFNLVEVDFVQYLYSVTFDTAAQLPNAKSATSFGVPPRRIEVGAADSPPAAIRFFEAEQSFERLLLKEYLGVGALGGDAQQALHGWEGALSGENEIAVYEYILAQVQDDPDRGSVPRQLPHLIGYMQTGRSIASDGFAKIWEAKMPGVAPPTRGSLWLVFRWEALHRLSLLPDSARRAAAEGGALGERAHFVKMVIRQSLGTLGWLHSHGAVHRTISQSSLRLNTLSPSEWRHVHVQLCDFGFATTASQLTREDLASTIRRGRLTSPLEVLPMLCLEDLRALGYVLLELVLNTLSEVAPADSRGLRVLLEGKYKDNVAVGFREYLVEDMPYYAAAVAFLDESDAAGWRLIENLITAPSYGLDPLHSKDDAPTAAWKLRVSAQSLQRSAWFSDLPVLPTSVMLLLGTEDAAPPGDAAEGGAFLERWQRTLAEWWVTLPVLTREGLKGCFPALGLHIASSWGAHLAALQRLASGGSPRGAAPPPAPAPLSASECETLPSSASGVELPHFPRDGPHHFRAPVLPIPMLPGLLPDWRALERISALPPPLERPHALGRAQPSQRPSQRRLAEPLVFGLGGAAGAAAALLLGWGWRRSKRSCAPS